MQAIDRVIRLAKEEVGYLEKASAYDLDSKYANPGTANYTKYARDVDKAGLLNGMKQGYPWCTVFVIWLMLKAFGAETAKQMLFLPDKSLAAGCKFAVEYYKAARAYGTEPKLGAQIFFKDAEGVPCHTGIVVDFDDTYVYTVEGNTSGASGVVANGGGVAAKTYRRSYSRIHGYGYPNYDLCKEEVTDMTKEELTALVNESVEKKVREILSGKDTQPSDWAKEELRQAMEAGITDGTRPQGYATRQEVAAMVLRAVKHTGPDLPNAVRESITNNSY